MKKHEYKKIPVSKCDILERNPQFLTEKTMERLKQSIKKDGFLSPILVHKQKNGRYRIVSGNHRFLATKELGLEFIPAVVGSFKDQEIKKLALNLNFIHGDPPAELIAPFLAEIEDLSGIHIPDYLIDDLEKLDVDIKRITNNEIPEMVDNSVVGCKTTCTCPKCGKVHVKK